MPGVQSIYFSYFVLFRFSVSCAAYNETGINQCFSQQFPYSLFSSWHLIFIFSGFLRQCKKDKCLQTPHMRRSPATFSVVYENVFTFNSKYLHKKSWTSKISGLCIGNCYRTGKLKEPSRKPTNHYGKNILIIFRKMALAWIYVENRLSFEQDFSWIFTRKTFKCKKL